MAYNASTIVDCNSITSASGSALTLASSSGQNISLTPGTTGFVTITKTAATSTRETILKATVSDAGNDAFYVYNGTANNSSYMPGFAGYMDSINSKASLHFQGFISAANDASDSASIGVLNFEVARTISASDPTNGTQSAIVNRKLITFSHAASVLFTLYPTTANFSSTITTLTLNSTTASTSTTTGALVVSGGVGVAGASFFGSSISCGTVTSSSTLFSNAGNGRFDSSRVVSNGGSFSTGAWGTSGVRFLMGAVTATDNTTASSGTVASAVFASFAQPTLAAFNTSVTTTNAATVYIENSPATGTNQTITNAWALWVDAGNVRFDGSLTTAGGATFHTTNTALTDGAGAATGTLLNAPSAGNPTKWIGINDNGTTRYIPAW